MQSLMHRPATLPHNMPVPIGYNFLDTMRNGRGLGEVGWGFFIFQCRNNHAALEAVFLYRIEITGVFFSLVLLNRELPFADAVLKNGAVRSDKIKSLKS